MKLEHKPSILLIPFTTATPVIALLHPREYNTCNIIYYQISPLLSMVLKQSYELEVEKLELKMCMF